jgi:vancomycin resistance protein YoaR
MSDKYYQKYGPIHRRRAAGELDQPSEEPPQRPDPAPRRPREQRPIARRRSVVVPVLLGLIAIVSAALVFPYASTVLASNIALDNVSVQGQLVSQQSLETIKTQLADRYAPFVKQPVTLTFEGQSWTPTLADLGATLDLEATAAQAVGAGRSGDLVQRAQQLWQIYHNGIDVPPTVTIDANQLQRYLTQLAGEIEQPPRDAALSLTAGKVLPTPAAAGRQVLVDATQVDVIRALQSLAPQSIALRTRLLAPQIDDTALAPAVAQAQTMLRAPLVLKREEQIITWDQEQLASLLDVAKVDGQVAVVFDGERVTEAVERLAQVINSGSVEPRVAMRGGVPVITQPGVTGWRLQQPEAAMAITSTLLISATREITLPIQLLDPQVTPENLATLGLTEVVGEGVSSFAGSASYRITNIAAGAARMDGVLIAPDEEFSFNAQLGAVDASNGFVQGYAVIGNRTQLEWGGGVCQDSTTLFRAAFWAGLPITERHAHPFYISWYDAYAFPNQAGPGLDAAIFTGVQDLRFVNDTGSWLLIDAVVDQANQVLTMRLYGTKPNRSVALRGPIIDNIIPPPAAPVYIDDPTLPAGTVTQTDVARRGMEIAVYRIITDNGTPREPELFYTRFKAWPDVFVRGTRR